MKVNFNQKFKEMDGKESDKSLKDVVCPLLAGLLDVERSLPADDRFKRGALAQQIFNQPEIELKSEQIALIKTLIGKGCPPIMVFQAWNMLEGVDESQTTSK